MLRNDLEKAKYVSIHFDASNRKTTKMFPVLIKFFDPKEGVKVRFLEMYSIKKENAVYLVDRLIDAINKIGPDKVISLCADNVSTLVVSTKWKAKMCALFLRNISVKNLSPSTALGTFQIMHCKTRASAKCPFQSKAS